MTVPYWVQDAIFYQIFPDRFANGDAANDPPNKQNWGAAPTIWGFQGGDLRGMIEKFDYLLDLGVTAVYLNPIFQATSNHRYNTSDYYRIDPKLGDLQDFRALLEVAHRNHVRVILDGVFNHTGRGFFAFNDILENREHSPYRDWYHINRFPVDAYSPGESSDYLAWWGFKSLPKLNTDNPAVRKYLLGVARYWIEQGADGWRLDVPNEIDDDAFWAEFRDTVKSVNRDAYLVGEIWDGDLRWVGDRHFDGLMQYPVRDSLIDLLQTAENSVSVFADRVEGLLHKYPEQNVRAMYVPLGSHDTERLATLLGGELCKLKLAFLFLLAYPGAPAIYYGDEIGIPGDRDPDCRRAFPWDSSEWNQELRSWVQKLIALRKSRTEMRRGSYERVQVDNRRSTYAFARKLGASAVLVVFNAGPTRRHLRLPVGQLDWQDGHIVRNLLGSEEYIVTGEELSVSLEPWSGAWIA